MSVLLYTPLDSASTIEIELGQQESVLEALLRSGFDIPNGCRAGACQSCLMKTDAADVPLKAQAGLKDSQRKAGYFLSCSCFPEEVFPVTHPEIPLEKQSASVSEKSWLSNQVIRLRIRMDNPDSGPFRAGQYMTLWKDDTTARCYSIASDPDRDGYLEFHIKHIPGGAFSHWAASELKESDRISLQGPLGDCFYAPENKDVPLLLCGMGTGLAPLYGIVKNAIANGHKGSIALVVGTNFYENFYLKPELSILASGHPNLTVIFVPRESEGVPEQISNCLLIHGDIYQAVKTSFADLNHHKIYLCGAETFVRKMKKQCFLQGAAMMDIHSDAFLAFR
ncbi:MAG: 2Fe-2S iron-sulfur cluster binding domain-containing protein [Pseudomonadales bacterium]|nr:2Fe-2S iron-sulfur cluster binding domain-containing protein [Pseudomonadales bacterium]MCP5171568.1 2Fe-2S iron-sulfur cluster binding domain-containing protein [Pseudomonadales bacterium]